MNHIIFNSSVWYIVIKYRLNSTLTVPTSYPHNKLVNEHNPVPDTYLSLTLYSFIKVAWGSYWLNQVNLVPPWCDLKLPHNCEDSNLASVWKSWSSYWSSIMIWRKSSVSFGYKMQECLHILNEEVHKKIQIFWWVKKSNRGLCTAFPNMSRTLEKK